MLLILYLKSIRMNTLFFQRNFVTASCPLVPLQVPSRLETHLWYVVPDEVKSAALLSRYSDILSPCEKENVSHMRGDQLKKRALLARVLVRTTIARYQIGGQIDPKSLKFRKNIHGKPELECEHGSYLQSPLQFNISHTSSLIACGVTVDSPIGIDVEERQRNMKSNILAFARRYFSPEEVDLLSSISDPESQRQQFIKLWTLKEAYVKALGKGFSAQPFKTFTIRLTPNVGEICLSRNLDSQEGITVESADEHLNLKSNWQFTLLELAGSHYAAICVKRDQTGGGGPIPSKLTVRKTIPYVGDEVVDGSDAIVISA